MYVLLLFWFADRDFVLTRGRVEGSCQ